MPAPPPTPRPPLPRALAERLGRLFGWWLCELEAAFGGLLPRARPVALAAGPAGADGLPRLVFAEPPPAAGSHVRLVLPAGEILETPLDLPAVAILRLDAILGLKVAAEWPLPGEPPVWRAEMALAPGPRLVGRLAMVRPERAAEAAALARAARLRGAGLTGTGLTGAGPTETRPTERRPTGAGFALPAGTPHGPTARPEIWPEIRPEIVREGSRRRRAWPFLPVFASALALAVALGGWTHLDRLSAARTEASEELRRLRLAARPAVAHEARRRALLEALAGLSHRAGNGGRGIDIVEALAAALPDDAWLEAVTIEATEVRLRGRAADPAIALRALGASDVFTEARFAAPVMAEAGSALSRFELLLGRPGRAPDGASQ